MTTEPENLENLENADIEATEQETELQAEEEMVAEGGAVTEATDPEIEEATVEADEAVEAVEEPVQEGDLTAAESPLAEGAEGAEVSQASGASEADDDSEYRARLRKYVRELKKLPGEWYIIQSYSGYENKVKTNLDMRIQTLEVEDSIYDVVVPIEQAIENKDGKKKLVKRKLLPGYVLVRMDMNDAAWSVVRETPGVTSFVGNEGNATPVKHRDVAKFLMPKAEPATGEDTKPNAEGETVVAMPEEAAPKKIDHDYKVGEAVTILSGALASVSATISEIDEETGKIQALVSIFGRETPVELTADQIERIM
ncbi:MULTISPECIES: transcription termination/antitermination protein NusG [Corynebacterium]|uniref:transcription termination/antitermination protein NusG n=1 Tax=Corynebacterium TaxID=1716 RepID=UPI00210A0E3D|nr:MULTISPECIES: transcription termination/antitermination protein NusG [Corynebacterium]MCQ4615840.1 transcription termination/antitermination protein NusG [Corynebacterium pseudogenitalium]UUA87589.1 transcription termination/antitermination protein NusG [Corynebacterium pseudogenitalium]WPJ92188.1 transcription termination/antitermination protein NusG [Corynebacterium sp. UMB2355A]